jgi:hypothetical protein
MTFSASDPVSSGMAYDIISVGTDRPERLDQFVGAVAFSIGKAGTEAVVSGLGSEYDGAVRFQEKDTGHDGKDVRVWHIEAAPDGRFTAATVSSF